MSRDHGLEESETEERSSRRANPVDVHVGARVRLRRMLLGMSQEKLGEHLGLTFQQIQKYEKGINRIGASRLFDLSQVLGVPVQFFGHTTLANSTIMRLARQYDCPVHGVRIIRLPKNRFRVELTDALELPRDAKGRYSIQPSMQTIMSIIEGWIREHPEQWLWLHDRWRHARRVLKLARRAREPGGQPADANRMATAQGTNVP